jgi:HSP20 family protein
MNTITKRNGSLPTLLSDFFSPATVLGRDFFDMDPDFSPSCLGINIPSANITETPKEYKIELAAPGLERKDFDLDVNNHTLTISAEKEEEKNEETNEFSRKEYSFNSFTRSFALPENIKGGNIDAKYENGVLRVTLPKIKETPVKASHKIAVS